MTDAVVVGAGPNGLVAANLLADAGWSVTVLEAADEPGGAVRTAELTEPGFRHDRFSAFYPLAAVSPVFAGLRLEDHGLRWRRAPVALAHPLPDGRCAAIGPDVASTAASVDAFFPGDGAAWTAMVDEWRTVAAPFLDCLFRPFPPVGPAVRLAGRLGRVGTLRFARQLLLPVRRMAEERFGGDGAAVLLGGNALHADLAPEAAGSGLYGWLLGCLAQEHGNPVPEGGAGQMTAALVRRLERRGGSVRCGSLVTGVVVRGGRAVAVRTADGTEVDAGRAVLADVSAPALYGRLLDPDQLPAGFLGDLGRFQWDSGTVKVDWALDGPVPWAAEAARRAGTVHVADDVDNLTEHAAQLAMGRLPGRPFVLFGQPAVADPTRSPPGTGTAWAYARVPRRVRGDAAGELDVAGGQAGWLERFADRMEARVEALAPGFGSLVRARHVAGPADLEAADANLDGGAVNGGTAALHQQVLFRPLPGAGRPETPVAGLYLASASAHPGGGVHGAAGANAARAALLPAARARSVLFGRGPVRSRR
ncbi:MAG TPA: NAD(P)/FAD-dependent oxidoreductase [Acidimicrobiales bacterium]|nr:NAD(P)/FAD-dependent oxidoreductase [Acidimicrobiales bacterium]